MTKMERLTDVNVAYYEVANMMLILTSSMQGIFSKTEHYGNSNLTSYIVWYPKKSIPNTRMVTGNSEWEGGPKSKTGNPRGGGV